MNGWKLTMYIFYNLLFLSALIYTLVISVADHKCVFPPDGKVCYTDLVNETVNEGTRFMELTRKNSSAIPHLQNNEVITFEYTENDQNKYEFDLVLNYNEPVPSGGVCWPSNTGICSGYATFSTGVSIYLGHYHDNTVDWPESYKVINEGLSVLLYDDINVGGTSFNATISPIKNGFDYTSGVYSTTGMITVSSTASGPSTYFQQLTTTDQLTLTKQDASPHEYNPFIDFFRYKESRAWSPSGVSGLKTTDLNCIDPSAINLPSCHSPFVPGKGYVYTENSKVKYSNNCSNGDHLVQQGPDNSPTDKYANTRAGQLNIPANTTMQDGWTAAGKDSETRRAIEDSIKIGNKNPVDAGYPLTTTGIDLMTSLYFPNALFCGTGSTANPSAPMYTLRDKQSDLAPKEAYMGSCFPNARKDGNKFILGF